MAEDPVREIRTMILLSLPFPPLPVEVDRIAPDEARTGGTSIVTTHDLVARGLNECSVRNDPVANTLRRGQQRVVFRRLLHAMAEEGFALDGDSLYRLYGEFSRQHLKTYFPPDYPVELRFQPLHMICRGDAAHQKMCEYMAAQSILYEDQPHVPISHYEGLEFIVLLRLLRDRLGHVMTQEERAMLDQA